MEQRAYSDKNIKVIDPLHAPEFYDRHFNRHESWITIPDLSKNFRHYDLISRTDDPKSGFQGSVFLDKNTGHAVVLFKGMDIPLKDEGHGRLGFLRDIFTAAQSFLGKRTNSQSAAAEKIYLDTLQNPDVKSVETIGFSLGTLHVNHVAAKYGAVGTVLSDLGSSDRSLEKIFNQESGADADENSLLKKLRENVTVLDMGMDLLTKFFSAGPSRGTTIRLDEGPFPDLSGLFHRANTYARKAKRVSASTATALTMG